MDDPAKLDLPALRVVRYPAPVLSRPADPVSRFDEALRRLAERMFELMYAARGVGLAAPQVGVGLRMFIVNPTGKAGEDERVYVNPVLVDRGGSVVTEEGCLSVPGLTCKIKRHERVTVEAVGLDGQPFGQEGEGILARIFQHEVDHLDGMLVSDRMSTVARLANRRLLRRLEGEHEGG